MTLFLSFASARPVGFADIPDTARSVEALLIRN
jgi:hypothetical protein